MMQMLALALIRKSQLLEEPDPGHTVKLTSGQLGLLCILV